MAKINRNSVIQDVIKFFRLSPTEAPLRSFDAVMPVYNVRMPESISKANSKNTTGSLSIYTTSSSKDTYLTTAHLSVEKNATCDNATGDIFLSCVIDGATVPLLVIPIVTLLASSNSLTISFPEPIKVDRNTAIVINGSSISFTAGARVVSGGITAYEEIQE